MSASIKSLKYKESRNESEKPVMNFQQQTGANDRLRQDLDRMHVEFANKCIALSDQIQKVRVKLTERQEIAEEVQAKFTKRVIVLERDLDNMQNDLVAHKYLKQRQIENLEDKAWEMHDYKEEMTKQLDTVVRHTFEVNEHCAEKLNNVQNQFHAVKEPLIHQVSNLICQNELLQRELMRSQKINREIMVDAKKMGAEVVDKDSQPYPNMPHPG